MSKKPKGEMHQDPTHSQSNLNASLLSQSRTNHQQSYNNLSSKVLPYLSNNSYSKDQMSNVGLGKSVFGGAVYIDTDSTQNIQQNMSLYKQQSRLASITQISQMGETKRRQNSLKGGPQLSQIFNMGAISPVCYNEPLSSKPILEINPNSFVKIQKYTTIFKSFSHKSTDTQDDGRQMLGIFSVERDQKEYELRMLMQQTEFNIVTLNQAIQNKTEYENKSSTEVANRLRDMAKIMNKNYQETEIYLMDQVRNQGLQQEFEQNDYENFSKDLQFQVSLVQKSTAQRIFRLASTKMIQQTQLKNPKQVMIAHDKKKKYNKVEVLETMLNQKQQEFEKKAYEFQDLCQKFDSHDNKLQNLIHEIELYKTQVTDMEAQKSMENELKVRLRRNEQATQVYIADPVLNSVTQQLQVIMVENSFLKEEMRRHAAEAVEQKSKLLLPKNMEETFIMILNSDLSPQEMIMAFQELLHMSYQSQNTTIKQNKPIDIFENLKKTIRQPKNSSDQDQQEDDFQNKKKISNYKIHKKSQGQFNDGDSSISSKRMQMAGEEIEDDDLDIVGEVADDDIKEKIKVSGSKRKTSQGGKYFKSQNNSQRGNQPQLRKSRIYDSQDLSDDNIIPENTLSKDKKTQQQSQSQKTKAFDQQKFKQLDKSTQTKQIQIIDDDGFQYPDNTTMNDNKKSKFGKDQKTRIKTGASQEYQDENTVIDPLTQQRDSKVSYQIGRVKQQSNDQDPQFEQQQKNIKIKVKQVSKDQSQKSPKKVNSRQSVDNQRVSSPKKKSKITKEQGIGSTMKMKKTLEQIDTSAKQKQSNNQARINYENNSVDEVESGDESSHSRGKQKSIRRKNKKTKNEDNSGKSEFDDDEQDDGDNDDKNEDEQENENEYENENEDDQDEDSDVYSQNSDDLKSEGGTNHIRKKKKNRSKNITSQVNDKTFKQKNRSEAKKIQQTMKDQTESKKDLINSDGRSSKSQIKRDKSIQGFNDSKLDADGKLNEIEDNEQIVHLKQTKFQGRSEQIQIQQLQNHNIQNQLIQNQQIDINEMDFSEKLQDINMRNISHINKNYADYQTENIVLSQNQQNDQYVIDQEKLTHQNINSPDIQQYEHEDIIKIDQQQVSLIEDKVQGGDINKILSQQQQLLIISKQETLNELMTQLSGKKLTLIQQLGNKCKIISQQFLNHDCYNHKPCGDSCIHLQRFLKLIGFQNYKEKRKQIKLIKQEPQPFTK